MPLYSSQYFHKPLYFINIACIHFPFSYPWEMLFLFHQFGSSISESLTIHRCAFVEREWKESSLHTVWVIFPSIFNNSMTVWQQRLAPICPLWHWVYHYRGTKASHPATGDNIFMHQQFVWKMRLYVLQKNLVILDWPLLLCLLAKLINSWMLVFELNILVVYILWLIMIAGMISLRYFIYSSWRGCFE